MKQFGFTGKGTGRLGSSVFAISGGAQIVRQYNPIVANPSTDAQVAQRSKLKLMSQIAASLAATIAIPRNGLQSGRNIFTKNNIALVTYADNTAQVTPENLKVTNGAQDIPVASWDAGDLEINFAGLFSSNVKRVVINYYTANADGSLSYAGGKNLPIVDGTPSGSSSISLVNGSTYVVYIYGLCSDDEGANANYGNYALDASQIAKLISSQSTMQSSYYASKSQALKFTYSA